MSLVFDYKLLDNEGGIASGQLEAENRGEALKQLKEKGTLLDLVQREAKAEETKWGFPVLEFRKIRPAQLAFMFRQLGELIDAGMPLVSAISSLQKFCGNQKTRSMLEDVGRRIRSGESFSDSLAQQQGVFSKIQLSLVKVGERSGNLPDVLHRIADLMEAQLALKGKIRSALSYPVFVLVFSSLLCWGLVTFLLPQFEPIWTGAKLDLTQYPVTEALLAISKFTRSPVDEVFLFIFLSLTIGVFAKLASTDDGRDWLGDFSLKIPLLGNYLRLTATAGTSSTIAMLLDSGMSLTETLDLAAETATNPIIGNGIKTAATSVRQGNPLSTSLDDTNVFPELFIQMVSVGETSADLPGLLKRVSEYYSRQLDDSLKSLTSLIEPITMVMIGGIVFIFVLGVFMPIMGIVSALSNQG
jgi:type IV pilus assembly protein PilC